MYNFVETPFHDFEVQGILRELFDGIKSDGARLKIDRNVICMMREDGSFNFPNFFDIVSLALSRLKFDREEIDTLEDAAVGKSWKKRSLSKYSTEDYIFSFIDDFACDLEMLQDEVAQGYEKSLIREVCLDFWHDPYGVQLRTFSKTGSYVLNLLDLMWPSSFREFLYCCVATVVYHRSLEVLSSRAMLSATTEKVLLIQPGLSVFNGKLHSYISDLDLLTRKKNTVNNDVLEGVSFLNNFISVANCSNSSPVTCEVASIVQKPI